LISVALTRAALGLKASGALAAAFVTSLAVRAGLHLDEKQPKDFAVIVLITVAVTTVTWLTVTWLTKPEPKEVLLSFYRRVRPSPALWGPVAREATDIVPRKDGLFNLLDWVCGVFMIYAFLFGAGKVIFGNIGLGLAFLAAGVIFGAVIYADLDKRGWETVGK